MANDKKTIKEVKAFARHVHMSPRKVRLVADMVRKSPVDVALEQLRFSSKNAATPLIKVINSAIANAIHNFEMPRESLYIKSVTVDGGPVSTRYAPRAQGRAFVERKRTSHINVILESRPGQTLRKRNIFLVKSKTQFMKAAKAGDEKETTTTKAVAPKQAPKTSEARKQNTVTQKRRMFNRKSGE